MRKSLLGSLVAVSLAMAGLASKAAGQGWTDYEIRLPNGHMVFRPNAECICLTGKSTIIVGGEFSDGWGLMVSYAHNQTHTFVILDGIVSRRLFTAGPVAGEPLLEYYIADAKTDYVIGPLFESQFYAHPIVAAAGPLNWSEPAPPWAWVFPVACCVILFGPILLLFLVLWMRDAEKRRYQQAAGDLPSH